MLLSPLINIYSLQNLDVEINELVQNLYLVTFYRSKGHFAVAWKVNKANLYIFIKENLLIPDGGC